MLSGIWHSSIGSGAGAGGDTGVGDGIGAKDDTDTGDGTGVEDSTGMRCSSTGGEADSVVAAISSGAGGVCSVTLVTAVKNDVIFLQPFAAWCKFRSHRYVDVLPAPVYEGIAFIEHFDDFFSA